MNDYNIVWIFACNLSGLQKNLTPISFGTLWQNLMLFVNFQVNLINSNYLKINISFFKYGQNHIFIYINIFTLL